jgi:hypothetical protein
LFLVASLNRALWLYPLRNLELVRRPARLHLQHQNRSGGRQVPMVERRVGSTRSNDRPNLGYTSRRGAAIFPTAGCGRVAPLPAVTAARGWSCRTAARARIEGAPNGIRPRAQPAMGRHRPGGRASSSLSSEGATRRWMSLAGAQTTDRTSSSTAGMAATTEVVHRAGGGGFYQIANVGSGKCVDES